mmetsp:Transcript_42701/g.100143  ORF Transcript_42701/g.100143 Transcript_42701/m.100143 type:complete len:210 (+) Transcript_42701:1231-1860(+)
MSAITVQTSGLSIQSSIPSRTRSTRFPSYSSRRKLRSKASFRGPPGLAAISACLKSDSPSVFRLPTAEKASSEPTSVDVDGEPPPPPPPAETKHSSNAVTALATCSRKDIPLPPSWPDERLRWIKGRLGTRSSCGLWSGDESAPSGSSRKGTHTAAPENKRPGQMLKRVASTKRPVFPRPSVPQTLTIRTPRSRAKCCSSSHISAVRPK